MNATGAGDEQLTVEEARKVLGYTKNKMAFVLREGILKYEPHPVDKRIKLIRRSDVDALLRLPHAKPRPKEMRPAA